MLNSVLVVGAHPDDETILTGGTIALMASHGVKVFIVCATRGEGGELGEPPVSTRTALGQAREAELHCAVEALGATQLFILDYVDPLIGPDQELFPFEADFATLTEQIRKLIRQTDADITITHGSDGEYGHPAHQLLHRAVKVAVEHSSSNAAMYSFAAHITDIEDHIWNENDPAHLALDISPWLDIKEAAASCHVSQHALFKRRKKAQTIREVLRTTESFHRHAPPMDQAPLDGFAELLIAAGAWLPHLPE